MTIATSKLRCHLVRAACAAAAALWMAAGPGAPRALPETKVNRHAQLLEEFRQNVAKYVALHDRAAGQLPPLKPTPSSGKILEHQRVLAAKIRAARPHARQGELFTPPVAREFRRLIHLSLRGPEAVRIRTSLRRSAPVTLDIKVNGTYPRSAPLETTPPSLLLNLPNLPPELEYRVVGHALALRDVKANLIVDFIPHAIP